MSGDEKTLKRFLASRGSVVELHPDVARVAIEGYTDELSPAHAADEAFYRQFTCPSCGSSALQREFLVGAAGQGITWVEGEVTPQALLRCSDCRCLFNPRSEMIVETGSYAPVFDEDALDPGLKR